LDKNEENLDSFFWLFMVIMDMLVMVVCGKKQAENEPLFTKPHQKVS